jgi:hypothetical protein
MSMKQHHYRFLILKSSQIGQIPVQVRLMKPPRLLLLSQRQEVSFNQQQQQQQSPQLKRNRTMKAQVASLIAEMYMIQSVVQLGYLTQVNASLCVCMQLFSHLGNALTSPSRQQSPERQSSPI